MHQECTTESVGHSTSYSSNRKFDNSVSRLAGVSGVRAFLNLPFPAEASNLVLDDAKGNSDLSVSDALDAQKTARGSFLHVENVCASGPGITGGRVTELPPLIRRSLLLAHVWVMPMCERQSERVK